MKMLENHILILEDNPPKTDNQKDNISKTEFKWNLFVHVSIQFYYNNIIFTVLPQIYRRDYFGRKLK